MNRITAISLLTLGSLASCAGAIAQQPAMKANIPFNFNVGNTWMPAGEYTISTPLRHVLEFQSADHANIATVVSSESHDESNSGSKLVFTRYGNQYFLHRVLCPTVSELNLDLAAGKTEKAARKRSLEAKNLDNGQETLVAAK
jgi:hypothetical protein